MKDIMRERKEGYWYYYLLGNLGSAGAGEQEAGPRRCQEQGEEGEEGADETKAGVMKNMNYFITMFCWNSLRLAFIVLDILQYLAAKKPHYHY